MNIVEALNFHMFPSSSPLEGNAVHRSDFKQLILYNFK